MADTIKSRAMEPYQLFEDLNSRVNEANASYGNKVASPLTITLGDEFQGIAETASEAVSILINFEEKGLKSPDAAEMRWVIWYGRIDTPINTELAHGMIGQGLTDARTRLNALKRRNMPRIMVTLKNDSATLLLNNAFKVYDSIRERWNNDDKKVVADFLMLGDYKMVAKYQGKTRSQLWKRKNNLMMEAYNATKVIINNLAALDV